MNKLVKGTIGNSEDCDKRVHRSYLKGTATPKLPPVGAALLELLIFFFQGEIEIWRVYVCVYVYVCVREISRF